MDVDFRRRWPVLAGVLLVVLVCHYLPPESVRMAPDDYKALWRFHDGTLAGDLEEIRLEQRPLSSLRFALQGRYLGDSGPWPYLLPLFSSSVLTLTVYLLIKRLVRNPETAVVCTLAFTLLPQIHEVHQSMVFAGVTLPCASYVLAAERFLAFSESGRWRDLALSWLCYGVGLWSYEVGALLPIALAVICVVQRRTGSWWLAGHFVLAMVYIASTLASYLPSAVDQGRGLDFEAGRFVRLFHHYAGFYIARTTAYGLWNFVQLPWIWLMAVIGLDALILKWIWSVAGKETALQVPRGALPAAFVLGLFFLVPIFLAQGVGIAGRHLLLPSIPICIWVIATLGRLKRRRQAAVALAALGLAVAQGTAWTHVVAARINDAVYRTVKEQQPALSKADRLVVDLASFRERIAYSWVPRDFDYVNTYFGAQALEELGVESMVWLATGRAHPPVHFAVSRPVFENDRLTFSEGRMTGAREFNQTPASVPLAGTVVLDFRLVFGDRFNSGQGAR